MFRVEIATQLPFFCFHTGFVPKHTDTEIISQNELFQRNLYNFHSKIVTPGQVVRGTGAVAVQMSLSLIT